jgi:hypothetical protein
MPLNSLLQGPARWIAGGGALIGIAGIVLGETLLRPTYEVLYSGAVSAAYCPELEERQTCAFVYDFTVANVGKETQDSLRIEWPLDMQRWDTGTQVSDIVASARATQQPQIQPVYEHGKTVYTISGLTPNTMVMIRASCLRCTPEQLQAMRETRPVIAARGTVSEGNPRASTLMRGFMNVLRLVGLFG